MDVKVNESHHHDDGNVSEDYQSHSVTTQIDKPLAHLAKVTDEYVNTKNISIFENAQAETDTSGGIQE